MVMLVNVSLFSKNKIISFERETEMVDNKKDKLTKAKSEIVKPDNEIKNFDIKRIAQQSQIHQGLHRKMPSRLQKFSTLEKSLLIS